jgi:hypothetical protein
MAAWPLRRAGSQRADPELRDAEAKRSIRHSDTEAHAKAHQRAQPARMLLCHLVALLGMLTLLTWAI